MIRPIQMQMILPQTEVAGNTQQHANQSIVNSNLNAASEVAKEVKHNSETVIKKDANQFAEYQYDASEQGNGTYSNPRKQKRHKSSKDEEKETDTKKEKDMAAKDGQPRINIQI